MEIAASNLHPLLHRKGFTMNKKIITGIVAAGLGIATFGSAADAAQSERGAERSCFGGIHKTINTEGALGFNNVGDVVKAAGGQGKNAIARGLCD
jgi:hypothetical protein